MMNLQHSLFLCLVRVFVSYGIKDLGFLFFVFAFCFLYFDFAVVTSFACNSDLATVVISGLFVCLTVMSFFRNGSPKERTEIINVANS
jgi:hypothetical protein